MEYLLKVQGDGPPIQFKVEVAEDEGLPGSLACKVARALALSMDCRVSVAKVIYTDRHGSDVLGSNYGTFEPNDDGRPPAEDWFDPNEHGTREAGLVDKMIDLDNYQQYLGFSEAVDILQPSGYEILGSRPVDGGKVRLFISDPDI